MKIEKYDDNNEKIINELFDELDVESMLEADASCGSNTGGCHACGCVCFNGAVGF